MIRMLLGVSYLLNIGGVDVMLTVIYRTGSGPGDVQRSASVPHEHKGT